MADWGLLGALGQGLQQGVAGYQQEREFARKKALEDALQKRQNTEMQASLMEKGLQQDDQGNVSYTPMGQMKNQLNTINTQRTLGESQPDTPESNDFLTHSRAELKVARPDLNDQQIQTVFPEHMSAVQAREALDKGLIGKSIGGYYGLAGKGVIADAMRSRADTSKDSQASTAADKIHNDKRIQRFDQQLESLGRGASVLQRPNVTNQEMAEATKEFANYISGGTSSAVSTAQKQEYNSMSQEWAGLQQYMTGKPTEGVPPEIKQRVLNLMLHAQDVMKDHQYKIAQKLKRNYAHNSDANANQDDAIEAYNPNQGAGQPQGLVQPPAQGLVQPTASTGGAKLTPDQRAALLQQISQKQGAQAQGVK